MGPDRDRSQDRILFHLKTRGARTAAEVATRLDMTPAGARQHLIGLETSGLVESEDRRRAFSSPREELLMAAILLMGESLLMVESHLMAADSREGCALPRGTRDRWR